MKIGLFLPSLNDGGVQKVMVNLYQQLKVNKIDVKIIVGDSSGKFKQYIKNEDIINFKKTKLKGDYKVLFSIINLKKVIDNNNYDSIVAAPGFSTISLIISNLLSNNKTKTILMVDNTISLLKKGKLKHKISYLLYKLFYKFADRIVVAHDVGKNDLIKCFNNINENKIIRIYHPLIDIKSIKQKSDMNHKWFNNNYYVIFTAGRLCKEKNYTLLIDSFKIFKEKVPNAKLIIAGQGEENNKIINKIKYYNLQNDVDMIGFTDRVIDYMKKSDLFVLSSKQEAFGIVLIEALASGIKIVSTDCESGAQREILENGKYGFLCKKNDINDLVKKMLLAYNVSKYDYKNCKRRAEDFSIENITDQYIKMFKDVIK